MEGYHEYERFALKREGRVLTVTITGTSPMNFIDGTFHRELSQIFAEIAQDRHTDAVVLASSGRCFCGGGDIAWFRSMDDVEKDEVMTHGRKLILDLLELPQPIIAAVQGPAMGLGATVPLFCDIVYASPEAIFGDPHVVVGLVAGDGGAIIWPWLVGINRAKEYLMTGDAVRAADAERIGLVNHVVPADQLLAAATDMAHRLAGGWQRSIRGTKTSVNKILREHVNLVLDTCLAIERQCMFSGEHDAAMTAFLAGRKRSGDLARR